MLLKKSKLNYLLLTFGLCITPPTIFAESSSTQSIQQEAKVFSQAELEQMLAPIALYPDSVLTHILIASTYPLEIVQANRWVKKHPDLDAAQALEQVEEKSWDPSVKALVPFPTVLQRLSDDLEWTQNLGDAFLQDEESVLQSIQSLRRKADQAGNLDKMENLLVEREAETIIIQPIEREVVYVPYYDTRVIYGNWHWVHHQPVYWDWPWHHRHYHHHHYYTAHHGLFSWHPRIYLHSNFWFSAFNWHNHHIIVLDHHHYSARKYRHRSHIITHQSARRWQHNPVHRRGVSYRTEKVSRRYASTRPSVEKTRVLRDKERVIRSQNKQTVTKATISIKERSANNASINRSIKAEKERDSQVTRQTRLKDAIKHTRDVEPKRAIIKSNGKEIKAKSNLSSGSNNRNIKSREDRQIRDINKQKNSKETQTKSLKSNDEYSKRDEKKQMSKTSSRTHYSNKSQTRPVKSSSIDSERKSQSKRDVGNRNGRER